MLLMLDVAVRRAAATRRHAVRRCQIDESMQRWLPGRFPFGFQGEGDKPWKLALPNNKKPMRNRSIRRRLRADAVQKSLSDCVLAPCKTLASIQATQWGHCAATSYKRSCGRILQAL